MSSESFDNSRRFLTSVLYVDDFEVIDVPDEENASLEISLSAEREQATKEPAANDNRDDGSPRRIDLEKPPQATDELQLVTEAFARAKLLCAVLDPGVRVPADIEKRRKMLLGAAKSADIVILDWKLYPSEEPSGGFAIEILKHLVQERPSALQMVCIYTADPNLGRIMSQISDAFDDSTEIGEFHLRIESLNIVILSKADYQVGVLTAADGDSAMATFDQLPGRLIEEFSKATAGLAPQFAIAALGAIRESSWLLSRTFSAEIDRGLITHCACLSDTADGLRHLVEAFTDELGFIVSEDEHVVASLDAQRVLEMSRQLRVDEIEMEDLATTPNMDSTALDAYFEDGNRTSKNAYKWLTKVHTPPDSERTALEYDLLFAHVLQSRRRYGQAQPSLTLGTIVRKRVSGQPNTIASTESEGFEDVPTWAPGDVAVCVMPLCDTDNLGGATRRFFFAPMNLSDDGSFIRGLSHVAVRADAQTVLARTKANLFSLVFASFTPQPESPRVQAVQSDGLDASWHFVDDDGEQYELLGELRPIYRQRLADTLAADAGRTAADLPEWIRRSEKPS